MYISLTNVISIYVLLLYFKRRYFLHSSEEFFSTKSSYFEKTLSQHSPPWLYLQITSEYIDFKMCGESTCVGVSRDCICK